MIQAVSGQPDVVIFGGGAAGLWVLDELTRKGVSALLLEAKAIGTGQTIASQGIIHGGLKYSLKGFVTPSVLQIRHMPAIWKKALAGESSDLPDLSATQMRSQHCHLWRTNDLRSRTGMMAAKLGLQVRPNRIPHSSRPEILHDCPGDVFELPEQVLSPKSFLQSLADQHRERLLYTPPESVKINYDQPGEIRSIEITETTARGAANRLTLKPKMTLFLAGGGNQFLRSQVGLVSQQMKRYPLHMVMLRGKLPYLNGHCIDGGKTRATITSDYDSQGQTVWQVGGQVAECGVDMNPDELIPHVFSELKSILPSIDFSKVEAATYRVDRAEGTMRTGGRPQLPKILSDGNCLTAWPTKLALVPHLSSQLTDQVLTNLEAKNTHRELVSEDWLNTLSNWTRPEVALPPWEYAKQWQALSTLEDANQKEMVAA